MPFLRVLICSVLVMVFFASSAMAGPTSVSPPPDVTINPPDSSLSPETKAFFGKTGRWWGTWYGTPAGHMEAILIVKKIIDNRMAEVIYMVPDYPTWGIKAVTIERVARFERREGRTFLVIPSPVNTRFECTFDAGAFIGTIRGPHLNSDIVWESF